MFILSLFLIVFTLYLFVGISWLIILIIQKKSFDLSDIGTPNKVIYPATIIFWPFFFFLFINEKIQKLKKSKKEF